MSGDSRHSDSGDAGDAGSERRLVAGIVDELDRRERRSGRDRRSDDSGFVGHVRAADEGLGIVARFSNIIVAILCTGVLFGKMYFQQEAIERAMAGFSQRLDTFASAIDTAKLDHQKMEWFERELLERKQESVALKARQDSQNDMLSSIIISASNAALHKQPSIFRQPTTPPQAKP